MVSEVGRYLTALAKAFWSSVVKGLTSSVV